MPIYVYECDSCGKRFEYMQSMSEPPKAECESCGGKLQKIIVPIAFHLKGGGWYKDLYSSSKPGSGAGGESAKSEGGKSEGGKSEGGKSEGSKSEGAKSESSSSKSGGGDK